MDAIAAVVHKDVLAAYQATAELLNHPSSRFIHTHFVDEIKSCRVVGSHIEFDEHQEFHDGEVCQSISYTHNRS